MATMHPFWVLQKRPEMTKITQDDFLTLKMGLLHYEISSVQNHKHWNRNIADISGALFRMKA